MKNVKIKTQLLIFAAILCALLLLLGIAGLKGMHDAEKNLERVYMTRVQPMDHLKHVADAYALNVVYSTQKLHDGVLGWEQAENQLRQALALAERRWALFLQHPADAEEQALIQQAETLLATAKGFVEQALSAIRNRDQPALAPLVEQQLYPTMDPLSANLGTLLDLQMTHAEQIYKAEAERYQRYFLIFSAVLVSGIIGALLFSYKLLSGINRPLQRLSAATNQLASGDFSARAEIGAHNELGALGQSFNQMAEKIQQSAARERQQLEEQARRETEIREHVKRMSEQVALVAAGDLRQQLEVSGDGDLTELSRHLNNMTRGLANIAGQIHNAGNAIASTLAEVRGATSAQSSSAAQQAAAVNETTTTLEEIRATSSQTLEKAQALGQSAERSRQESEQGIQAVSQAITGMNDIRERVRGIAETILALSEQTQQIGEITDVVANLAQQSKMLALNASIEAAKAGEAGKGFAVVASEVKDLAEQSQQSTTQVHKILQEIRHATDRAVMATEEGSKGVDAGNQRVERTREVMDKLSEVIRDTALASQQIVAVVRQEAVGIDQVANAMDDINQATNQFVAATRQTEQATVDLSSLAEQLRESVSLYRL